MPRIDPQQLLKCLSVLLSPNGGIKSQDEVQRLASLMTKFSKKLVSKCIYVSILKATKTDLLIMFMSAGGWDLTYSWLSDGVIAKNWPLVRELVDLLLICPVDIDRLKTNACPKLIKTLSKDMTSDETVRLLACKLVEHWLRIVKGDISNSTTSSNQGVTSNTVSSSEVTSSVPSNHVSEATSADVDSKKKSVEDQPNQESTDKCVNDSDMKNDTSEGSGDEKLPVYKITIRDGKKVLAEISGDRRLSTEVTEEEGSTETDDVNQEDEERAADGLEDEDDDLIKPVKIKKKPPAKKGNKQIGAKKPAKVINSVKKDRDSTDSVTSIGKSANKQTKKVKNDLPKSNSKSKVDSINTKIKDMGNIKNNVIVNRESVDQANLKQKEKSLSLKKKSVVTTKEKVLNKSEKQDDKERNIFDGNDILTDKEKESLSKFITPPISKVGKIPKKTSSSKEEKQSEEKNRTLKDDKVDNRTDFKKTFDMKKPEIKRPEKKISISVEPKKNIPNDNRPKTVKTFHSKFRSTGLEEEVKPPPPRPVQKKLPPVLQPVLGIPEKKFGKRSSPPPEVVVPEKRPKPESPQEEKKIAEKVGGIKLIPPKPKPMFLQESDVFMDAMLAANTMKEPRKRKRRISTSKDSGHSDAKKEAVGGSPSHSPKGEDTSPSSIKPTFKFYQDTLESSIEDTDMKMDESLEFAEPDQNSDEMGDDQKSMGSEDDRTSVKFGGPLKGVLVHPKSKKVKKSVTWKEDGLECIKYFELDETERVNVTKNFADMKNMEREHERENVQIARKLSVDDVMEERTRWKALIPIDIAAPVVAPGKNSQEKDIQYAREKTVHPAIYFNKRTIPDSPAEPDLEIHATTDPIAIPMDDITGSTDAINDFTNTPWPEPRGLPPAPAPAPAPAPLPPTNQPGPPAFQPGPGPPFPPQGPFPAIGPFMPGPAPPGMPMPPAGDCWRTGDGKVVQMPPEMFGPQGMMPPGMAPMGPPGPLMLPPGVTPDMPFPMPMPSGPNPTPEEMAQFGGGFPPMGPAPQQMFGPPHPPPMGQGNGMGGNWQNPGGGGGGGNWFPPPDNEQPPSHHNQGGGNQNRYQGNNWRGSGGGGSRGGGRNPDGWGGGGNSRTPICNNLLKRGFCRNNNCRFRHPR